MSWTVVVVKAGRVGVTVAAMHPVAATPARIAIAVRPSTTSCSSSPMSTASAVPSRKVPDVQAPVSCTRIRAEPRREEM